MRKKFFFSLLLATACTFFTCGCSSDDTSQSASAEQETAAEAPTGDNAASASGEVHLTIWTGEEDQALIQQISDNFIKEHAGEATITIDWAPMTEGECRSNVLGDILNAPDVYSTTDGDIRSLAAGGAASAVVNADKIRTENLEASVEAVTILDKLYAYPLTADNGYFLYYNKAFLSEQDVKSLDRILEVAEENGKKFAMDWSSGWYLYSFYGQTGLQLGLNSDGITNYCDWNSTTNSITGLDVANALLSISASPAFTSTSDWLTGITSGDVIACVSGVWDESAIKAVWGNDYGAAVLPTYTCNGSQVQMSSFFGYKVLGVNPYSEHLEWAHKFAEYISNEENQLLRFQMRGQGPSNLNAAKSPEIQQVPAIQAVLAQSEYSQLQRIGGNFWDPVTEFGNTMAAGNPEGLDLQTYLDDVVNRINSSTIQ